MEPLCLLPITIQTWGFYTIVLKLLPFKETRVLCLISFLNQIRLRNIWEINSTYLWVCLQDISWRVCRTLPPLVNGGNPTLSVGGDIPQTEGLDKTQKKRKITLAPIYSSSLLPGHYQVSCFTPHILPTMVDRNL